MATSPSHLRLIIKLLKVDSSAPFRSVIIREMSKQGAAARRKMNVKRQQDSLKWVKSVPAHAYLQVTGTDRGSPNGVYLFTDHRSYLFNCGEGLQRLAYEHKIKLVKIEHIFVTHSSWKNLGGLPGLTLTVQEMEVPKFNLHGPPEVEDIYRLTKTFVKARSIQIEKHEYDQKEFQDGSLKVTYVPLCVARDRGNGFYDVVDVNDDDDDHDHDDPRSNYEDTPESFIDSAPYIRVTNAKRMKLDPDVQPSKDISVAYICKLHNKPGELIMEKCMELGVPVGPILGHLKNGIDVTLENGKVVRSKDVVCPEEQGATFIVVECPTEDFLDSLMNADVFKRHQSTATDVNDIAEVVVHFTPKRVLLHPRYLEWISRFSSQTRHLFVNELCSGLCSSAVSHIQHKLHLVNSNVFPLLECEAESQQEYWKDVVHSIPGQAIFTEPLLIYRLRPKLAVDTSQLVVNKPDESRKEVLDDPRCVEKLTELQNKRLATSDIPNDGLFPEVTFLGTGSSVPNKLRNVTGIVVQLSSDFYILFDCGEGTMDQMLRFYGSEETANILRNLRAVFISHMHADHHMGLIKVLLSRNASLRGEAHDPVYVIAPALLSTWLSAYSQKYETLAGYRWISAAALTDLCDPIDAGVQAMMSRLQLKELKTVDVIHCKNAYGIVLTGKDGKKIVYSGDTMPCESLIKAGNQCHILIHEATMEDNLVALARTKLHSTTSEAIEVSQKMKAMYTILTHFSQRYAKIPIFNENFNSSIGIAFDNMKVRWCDLPLLSTFIPVLREIFSEDYDRLLDRGERLKKRQLGVEPE